VTLESANQKLQSYFKIQDAKFVQHVYPRNLAKQLNLAYVDEVLPALVQLLLHGVVVMHWDNQCPYCGLHTTIGDTLESIPRDTRCPACQSYFVNHMDNEVYVTFSAHPSLRKLPDIDLMDNDYHALIEQVAPTTGHEMLLVPLFRSWAQDQPLPADDGLEVSYSAIWFTDLSGSTAMYARRGDPQAFRVVRSHFDTLFDVVESSGGAVVKTLGDSVMAVFHTGLDALKAGIEAQLAMVEFNDQQNLRGDDQLGLKVGFHAGPVIVVTLNDRLDYFGQVVNTASRIEGLARAGDVTFSNAVFEEEGFQGLLQNYPVEALMLVLRGIEGEIPINRFRVID